MHSTYYAGSFHLQAAQKKQVFLLLSCICTALSKENEVKTKPRIRPLHVSLLDYQTYIHHNNMCTTASLNIAHSPYKSLVVHTSSPDTPRLTVPVGVHDDPVAEGDEQVHGAHDVGQHPGHLHQPRHGWVHHVT